VFKPRPQLSEYAPLNAPTISSAVREGLSTSENGFHPTGRSQGKYTQKAMKGLVANPEDPHKEVKGLIERSGVKLLSYYVTMGEYDWITIFENSDPIAALSGLAVAGAGGGLTDMKTTLAFTAADAKEAFVMANKAAEKFRAPGAS